MAALLVGMSIAAVLMTAVMPVWKQATRREKEEELIFRGQQYARAIGLFQKRAGPGVLPPNLDVLITQKFLRKKYKDPITGQDFDILTPTQNAPGAGAPGAPGGADAQGGRGRGNAPATQGRGNAPATQGGLISPQAPTGRGGAPGTNTGGVIGVASKSKEESLRVYNGRTHYNEWQFMFVQQTQAPGAGGPGRGGPGRGGPPQRGNVPGGPVGPQGGTTGRSSAPPPAGRGGFVPPPPPR